MVHPPVPPNIALFLEHGLRDSGRWRIPLILKLRPDVRVDDIRSVLTAVTNHHDALRVRIVERAGTWEQHVGEAEEFADLRLRSLPEGIAPGSAEERDGVFAVLDEHIRGQDSSGAPLSATYIRGVANGPCYLAIGLHGMVGDIASREILLADLFTAFGQRLAGEDIVLQRVTTPWAEWSQRCAALATHPAVLESRDFWLENTTRANLRVARRGVRTPEPTTCGVLVDADRLTDK